MATVLVMFWDGLECFWDVFVTAVLRACVKWQLLKVSVVLLFEAARCFLCLLQAAFALAARVRCQIRALKVCELGNAFRVSRIATFLCRFSGTKSWATFALGIRQRRTPGAHDGMVY